MIKVQASATARVDAQAIYELVSDLGTYPQWLEIVSVAEPIKDHQLGEPAWTVELRAQLGPLRRAKRLRMVRTVADAPLQARFVREELDGRSHSPWILTATIAEDDAGSTLTMDLHYGGSLWVPMLDRVLSDEIRRSSKRLVAMVEDSPR